MSSNNDGEVSLERLDLQTLTNLLLNPHQRKETQQKVVSTFAGLPPSVRTGHLTRVLRAMMTSPTAFDHDLMMSVVDLLATDPAPAATEAMFDLLPLIVGAEARSGKGISNDFRDYYYQALATRRREGDRAVWLERLPRLTADVLVGLLLDSRAKPLREIAKPLVLIDRLPRLERRKALWDVVLHGNAGYGWKALRMLLGARPERRRS